MSLGIDIGTTKAAGVICDDEGRQLAASSVEHHADLPAPPGQSLQAPDKLLDAARHAVLRLPGELRSAIGAVGVTGQMHGVLLLDTNGSPAGPLVTWQDQRCALEAGFLADLAGRTGRRLSTGYGCATLAWMVRHRVLPPAAAACTIQDFFAARLCGVARPVTDSTDAASFGLFDLGRLAWDERAVRAAGIPAGLLPRVVASGSAIGSTSADAARDLGIPGGIAVAAAIGDNQASLAATLEEPDRELMLTLGTGGQLSVIVPRSELGRWTADEGRWECRPYLDDRLLVVAASLSGGAAWRWLAQTAASWIRDAGGGEVSLEEIYTRMNELGEAATMEVTFAPHFLGERFDPGLRGAITGIGLDNFSLGSAARGLARGIIATLRGMLPEAALEGRERAVGSGNALRRNALLRRMASEVLRMPLRMSETIEEAAYGAARIAARLLAH